MSIDTYSAASVRQARERLLEAGVGAHGLTPRTLNVPPWIERSWRRSFTTGARRLSHDISRAIMT